MFDARLGAVLALCAALAPGGCAVAGATVGAATTVVSTTASVASSTVGAVGSGVSSLVSTSEECTAYDEYGREYQTSC